MNVNIFEEKAKSIAARLKEARIKAGFPSCRSFALANDLKTRTYLHHEKGDIETSISTLIKYSQLFNVSFLWLINGLEKYKNKPYLHQDVDAFFN